MCRRDEAPEPRTDALLFTLPPIDYKLSMRINSLAFTPALLCLLVASCGEDTASTSGGHDAGETPKPHGADAAADERDGSPSDDPMHATQEAGREDDAADERADAAGHESAGDDGPGDDGPGDDGPADNADEATATGSDAGNADEGSSDSSEPPPEDASATNPSEPSSHDGGAPPVAAALGASTFVFERKVADGNDHIVAMDYLTGDQRTITTLAEGTVAGWPIDGIGVSADRTRLVIATLYGATQEDIDTGLATNILWTLDVEGGDFRRLTPPFENSRPDVSNWRIDVRDPAFSPDGQLVIFDYGEGDFQEGYVAPWVVSTTGDSLPSLLETEFDCSVNGNSRFNPATGDLLLAHVVCLPEVDSGYYLYPSNGGAPDYIINEEGGDLSTEPPAFSHDGSVLAYTARTFADGVQSLYAYILGERTVVPLVLGAEGIDIVNASIAPDDLHLVYCVRQGDAYNLRLLDLTTEPATDVALTDDGMSCDPEF